ncbi:hypothetical protein CCACVL1_19489 [Corchorus capsularis]|uniref:Uncharacterized protein n=1 Tax=Corchorus capsularis TaxID=210143 RepID=A0A1R3HGH8_COCAP|nr:hypothetical protein CCACVL1_19489 [Corchorus capsularis]
MATEESRKSYKSVAVCPSAPPNYPTTPSM